jgi:hypothetical protein
MQIDPADWVCANWIRWYPLVRGYKVRLWSHEVLVHRIDDDIGNRAIQRGNIVLILSQLWPQIYIYTRPFVHFGTLSTDCKITEP